MKFPEYFAPIPEAQPFPEDFRAYAMWAYQIAALSADPAYPRKLYKRMPRKPNTGVPQFLGKLTLHQFSENMSFNEQAMLCEFIAYALENEPTLNRPNPR